MDRFELLLYNLISRYNVLRVSLKKQPHMKKLSILITLAAFLFCFTTCSKKDHSANSSAKLVFVFKFDSTQQRLNNIGLLDLMPAGNSGQSPLFNTMSSHYVELAPNAFTALGSGDVLYRAPEVTTGGSNAI